MKFGDIQSNVGVNTNVFLLSEDRGKEISSVLWLQLFICEVVDRLRHGAPIPDVPVVQGFIYEQNFFNFTPAQRTLAVQTETVITEYNVPQVLEAEPAITQMIVGKLYHLPFTYPVIDGVGHLESSRGTNFPDFCTSFTF